MSDWLMNDDASGDGYLGLDDPAMPDAAPAPPSAPVATAGDDWMSSGSDDWLGGASDDGGAAQQQQAAPMPGSATGTQVMDSGGDWMSGDHGGQPAVMPGTPAMAAQAAPTQQQYYQQQAAPMAIATQGDISVTAPQLQQVAPNPRSMGGAHGELSDLVLDVEVQVEIGLGNAALTVEEFLEMGRGSVVELDTPIDAPIDLRVRGKLIARGQLVSINGSYGMRIVEMLNEEN